MGVAGGVREKSTGLFELLLHRVLGLTVSSCIVSLVLMCHWGAFQSLCRLEDVVWVWHLGWTVCSSAGERVDEEGKGKDFAEFTGLSCTAPSLSIFMLGVDSAAEAVGCVSKQEVC